MAAIHDLLAQVQDEAPRAKPEREANKLTKRKISERKLNLVVDMNGCPNRCLHCWLGHMTNRRMEKGADSFIVDFFSPFFDKIAYYSWLREPDYCDDYEERWKRDLEISKNTVPERFELASFYRIVRDETYVPFLKSVGVKKVQFPIL